MTYGVGWRIQQLKLFHGDSYKANGIVDSYKADGIVGSMTEKLAQRLERAVHIVYVFFSINLFS